MSKKKILLFTVTIVAISVASVWYYVFVYSKNHHRNVAEEKGIVVTANEMNKEYQTNEQAANTKYLDKAVEVSGEVTEVGKNQEGKITVALKTDDAMSTVFCTLKDSTSSVQPNQAITIKGKCIGFTSDVRINEGIVIGK